AKTLPDDTVEYIVTTVNGYKEYYTLFIISFKIVIHFELERIYTRGHLRKVTLHIQYRGGERLNL
ncbi:hypothetical protein L9F63_003498, partial [Diploptera punctata]